MLTLKQIFKCTHPHPYTVGTRWEEGPELKSESGMMPFKVITRRILVLFLRAQRTAKVGESGR